MFPWSSTVLPRLLPGLLLALGMSLTCVAGAAELDAGRDILVTFENTGARAASSGAGAPYRNRKRYSISVEARKQAAAVAREYKLTQVDHWPIKHLSVYCFVYRVDDKDSRGEVLNRLRADSRVESAQAMNTFETSLLAESTYDDTYADLQYGLVTLGIDKAHRHSQGIGVRVAVIDSAVDLDHEDLKGRIARISHFADKGSTPDNRHGTAVASVIGALANNARGIVGVAPQSSVELYVACWAEAGTAAAICDSFTLAKAMDALLDDPPDLLNLSLTGPHDPLLQRLLRAAHEKGVISVAARAARPEAGNSFPASMDEVISVASSSSTTARIENPGVDCLYAPGERILVAVPDNNYDFRSGSSLAAAHVTGVIALLLQLAPDTDSATALSLLEQSQYAVEGASVSINACTALQLADRAVGCET